MTTETLFNLFNYGVLPFWALLVFAPRWRWTQRIVHSALIPAALGMAHLGFMLATTAPEGAGAHSLKAAMLMFDHPQLALVCWIHYLAFDLFVGAWEVRDAARRGIPHLAVAPCVILTLFFGPTGLLLYLIVRAVVRKTLTLDERGGPPVTASTT